MTATLGRSAVDAAGAGGLEEVGGNGSTSLASSGRESPGPIWAEASLRPSCRERLSLAVVWIAEMTES